MLVEIDRHVLARLVANDNKIREHIRQASQLQEESRQALQNLVVEVAKVDEAEIK